MNKPVRLRRSLEWTLFTFTFIKSNFLTIFTFGLTASIGRIIQLRAFGAISPQTDFLLEIIIWTGRIGLVLYVLGMANVKNGMVRIFNLLRHKVQRRKNVRIAMRKLQQQWLSIFANLMVFLFIAYASNLFIDHIAYETCLFITLTSRHLISDQSSVWTLILFFKNISVIPFTLVFQTLFILWIADLLPKAKTTS